MGWCQDATAGAFVGLHRKGVETQVDTMNGLWCGDTCLEGLVWCGLFRWRGDLDAYANGHALGCRGRVTALLREDRS